MSPYCQNAVYYASYLMYYGEEGLAGRCRLKR
jgi:hypothetical protein